jgi:pimeloyl-ACP methyl ester carboxylesterase
MTLNKQITGDGDNIIIFIHGNSQSLHTWDEVICQELLSNYTRIAVDLPGHGLSFRSTDPERDYTIAGFAAKLNDFLKAYAGKKYILIGTSLGSSIISALTPFPASCRGMLLSAAMLSSKNITLSEMLQQNDSAASGFKAAMLDQEIDQFIDRLIYRAGPEVKQHYKDVFKQTDPAMRAYLGKSSGQPPAIDRIENLISAKIPVAVVYGRQEAIVQPDYLNNTALPKWKNKIFKINNAGHCIELDQPEALAGLIHEFAADCFN